MENNIIEQEITQQTEKPTNKENQLLVYDESEDVVGFGAFFGAILLFAIPVVGWIACAIFMFAPKRKSLKNYARAFMAWLIIRFTVFALIIALVVNIVGGMVLPYINDNLGTQFNDMSELVGIVTDGFTGNYASIISMVKPQLLDALGEDFEPIIDEFTKEEYNDLIGQVISGDYAQALSDFESGKYIELKDVLGAKEYNALIDELEAAANGESSIFDGLREMIPSFVEDFAAVGGDAMDFGEQAQPVIQVAPVA